MKTKVASLVVLLLCASSAASLRLLVDESPQDGGARNVTWDYGNCPSELNGGGSSGASSSPTFSTSMPTSIPMPSVPVGVDVLGIGGGGGFSGAASAQAPVALAAEAAPARASGTIGFTTGGAQDVENYRENIEAGYLPLPTDVTFEGIVKDYYFDTTSNGNREPCTDLFCPLYSVGVAPDPLLSTDREDASQFYMAVGLDSGLAAADFQRPRLNLIVLLDVSGSMSSPFDAYYYDQAGNRVEVEISEEERAKTKMDVAKEVLARVVDQLEPDDSLGVVLFSSGACIPKPLAPLRDTDIAELKRQMDRDIVDTSGTNFQSGLDAATNAMKDCRECMEANRANTENRIIFITDAQPNQGDISEEGLVARFKANAADGIYTTVIGVGLDFNTELIESISKVRGANYFSVHSPGEFTRRLVDEFDFAVSPLVFDLALSVDPGSLGADGWKILHVYGSPNPNDTVLNSNGTLMQVHTLFPSPQTEEGIKGGVVLLRMRPPTAGNAPLRLTAAYTDRAGQPFSSQRTVAVPPEALPASPGEATNGGSYFGSTGARKAVLLARYTDLLHNWLLDQWAAVEDSPTPILIPMDWCDVLPGDFCPVPVELYSPRPVPGGCIIERWLVPDACLLPPPYPVLVRLLGRWERQSERLTVSPEARRAFEEFLPYFEAEMAAVNDPTLSQEVDIMSKILAA